jgi:hypothetical protein
MPVCPSIAVSTLAMAPSIKTAPDRWRATVDEDGHYSFAVAL